MLLNLLANAIKYNVPGGRVDVSFQITDAGRVRTTIAERASTEILKRLKAELPTREIRVIILTADASKCQSERVTRLGAAAYLTKPLNVPRFLEIIADTLAGRPTRKR